MFINKSMGTVNKNVDNGCYFLNFHLSWEEVVDHKPHDKRGRLVLNVPGWPASGRVNCAGCSSPFSAVTFGGKRSGYTIEDVFPPSKPRSEMQNPCVMET